MKTKEVITTLAIAAMVIAVVILASMNKALREKLENTPLSIDTVFINKPYQIVSSYRSIQIPKMVFIHKVDTVSIAHIEQRDSLVIITKTDSVKVEYQDKFLTNYPGYPKLIQLLSDAQELRLTTFNIDGVISTSIYPVDYTRFKYNYHLGELTRKKIPFTRKLSPVVQYTLRPVHMLHDLDVGLKYNTSKFNYELGLNLNYYPRINDKLRLDPYLRVSLNF